MKRPNCLKCKHYFSTYNKELPRGCRAYGIKTKSMPSVVVAQSLTGKQECMAFEERPAKKERDSYS